MIRGLAYVVAQSLGGLVGNLSFKKFFLVFEFHFSLEPPFSTAWCPITHGVRVVLVQLNLVTVSLSLRWLFPPPCKLFTSYAGFWNRVLHIPCPCHGCLWSSSWWKQCCQCEGVKTTVESTKHLSRTLFRAPHLSLLDFPSLLAISLPFHWQGQGRFFSGRLPLWKHFTLIDSSLAWTLLALLAPMLSLGSLITSGKP